MGWKNVKDAYGIGHIVRVVKNHEGGWGRSDGRCICIGSGYVHDIIVIKLSNLEIIRSEHIGRGKPFDDWVSAMQADKAKLRELIEAPDTFTLSIPVYTYDYDGNIIEKQCEEPGWPNITHDGECMYENTFSTDRARVVEWARENVKAAIENVRSGIADAERELSDRRKRLEGYMAAWTKLEGEPT